MYIILIHFWNYFISGKFLTRSKYLMHMFKFIHLYLLQLIILYNIKLSILPILFWMMTPFDNRFGQILPSLSSVFQIAIIILTHYFLSLFLLFLLHFNSSLPELGLIKPTFIDTPLWWIHYGLKSILRSFKTTMIDHNMLV